MRISALRVCSYALIISLGLILLSCEASNTSNTSTTIPAYLSAKPIDTYVPKSIYFQTPEKAIDFMREAAEFWKGTYDQEYGGFFTFVAQDGTIIDNNVKTTLTQSRIAYAFSRAYMVTGNKTYLDYAQKAVDFLWNKSADPDNGGFRAVVDRQGNSLDDTGNFDNSAYKWSFFQHYALLGIGALADATRSPNTTDQLLKARALIDEKLWDNRPGMEGYFDTANYDWSNTQGKGFTPTLDGITTHVLALYLLNGDEQSKQRLVSLGDQIVAHLIPTLKTRKMGFAESFDSDWQDKGEGFMFVGHVLKTAWCLQRINLVAPNPAYSNGASELMATVWEQMWDHQHGGPFMIANSLTGAIDSDVKENWSLEQAVTAGLINHYVTGNPIALEMADEAMIFYDRFLTDKKYGESLTNVSADGQQILDSKKGSFYKSGYHHIETGYYLYLYGNLFLQQKPVSLFYLLGKTDSDRTIKLNPVEFADDRLVITAVQRNGQVYSDFDGAKRLLRVPAGTDGEFKVTYTALPTQ